MSSNRHRILELLAPDTAMTLTHLAERSGLDSRVVAGTLRGLVHRGYASRHGASYRLERKGAIALRVFDPALPGRGFHFFRDLGAYTGITSEGLQDFIAKLQAVEVRAVEFHTARRDFANWLTTVFCDDPLAAALEAIRLSGVQGEALRRQLLTAAEARYREFAWLRA
jgi:DNA-binding Lrp family transcriptional regulator